MSKKKPSSQIGQPESSQKVTSPVTTLGASSGALKVSEETELLQEIAIAANQAASFKEALAFALEKICEFTDWPLAHIYILESELVENGRTDKMIASGIWHCGDEQKLDIFRSITHDTFFTADKSWLGQVMDTGQPAWIEDVAQDEIFPRNPRLTKIEVKTGFALPVLVGEEVVAILEFFPLSDSELNTDVPEIMIYIGTQLGRVVERNRAEREIQSALAQLRTSQQRLADAQHMARLGSWEWDLKSNSITWSDEVYRIYGLDKSFDLDVEKVMTFVHPEDLAESRERLQKFLETGEAYDSHVRIILPGNEIRYLRNYLMMITDDDGEPVRVLGTMQDETEYKLAADQISRKASQLAALNTMGQTAVSSLELDAVFNQVLETTCAVLQADGVFILLSESGTDTFRFVAVDGQEFQSLKGLEVPLSKSIAADRFRTNKVVMVQGQKAADHPVYQQVQKLAQQPVAVLLAAPMHVQEKLIGVLGAIHSQEDAFSNEDLSILETAAAWTAIAISNSQLYEELLTREAYLQKLTDQMVTAQEEERRRISRELHDESAQSLTALKLILEMMAADAEDDTLHQYIDQAQELVQETMQRTRLLAFTLRPPELDNLGLEAALRDLCRVFTQRTNITINYTDTEGLALELSEAAQVSFYRFLQEALTNVVRHAQATTVKVQLQCDDQTVSLRVRDDGIGFASPRGGDNQSGLGLLGMRERFERLGGRLVIESVPGQGTVLTASVTLS